MSARRSALAAAAASALPLAAGSAGAAEPLPSFTVDLDRTTVSGLSSGAFMAHQFHVAFSDIVQGAGVVAGGPYYCAQGQLALALDRCMQTHMGAPDPAGLLAVARGYAREGRIDPLENLADDRVYVFTGANDDTVTGPVVDAARRFYLLAGVPADGLEYRHDLPAGHAMITEDYGDPCPVTDPPYINDCDHDQAGAILNRLYPDLGPPADGLTGAVVAFDQTEFFAATGPGPVSGPFHGPSAPQPIMPGAAGFAWGWPAWNWPAWDRPGWGWSWPWPLPGTGSAALSLDDTGYAYVPAACAEGETCRVHIAFHGCRQTVADIQQQFVRHAGYNRWADDNGIIVLYPQAERDPQAGNPNGCWDWWGYGGADYATKAGPQMAAVRAMLGRLAGE